MEQQQCLAIGCSNPRIPQHQFCADCHDIVKTVSTTDFVPDSPLMRELEQNTSRIKTGSSQPAQNVSPKSPRTSIDFANAVEAIQAARAAEYDKPGGERSMAKVVGMFNMLKDTKLTERDGWEFMELLKMVRSQGKYHEDSHIDRISYSTLAAEAACKEAEVH